MKATIVSKPTPLVLECSLHVEVIGDRTTIDYRATGALVRISTPTDVWRAFCKRQLEVPPPLPKGDPS